MSNSNIEVEQAIEKPNLDNLEPWLDKYITEPFKGAMDGTNPNGTPFTREDAIESSKQQLRINVRGRYGTLDMNNQTRKMKGLPAIMPEEVDQDIIEQLVDVAASMK